MIFFVDRLSFIYIITPAEKTFTALSIKPPGIMIFSFSTII